MNLLKETIECIEDTGQKPSDIIFIGSVESGHSCTWVEFEKLADIDYDSEYGSQKIADDLIIVFSDKSIMCRGECDGSEWWEYTPAFEMPKDIKEIKTLCNGGKWESLEGMNEAGED